jgi:hypothetical protein
MPPMPPKPMGSPMPPNFSKPPMPGNATPPISPSLPPAGPVAQLNQQMGEAENAQSDLMKRISDLEKKLMEEKEKVLLATLKSKEEEAVSAKVETSIKEIQDKLRREKREQELDESRRKAEMRATDMERRIAEEREAWVSTLKSQLGQRDQITQEMELHFSTRLKDLEYRWSQEKSSLENIVRERESDIVRVRQELTLKAEQEKSFWEDRLKSVSGEKERAERDLERFKDKLQLEKEQFLLERQNLREQVSKIETTLRLIDEQKNVERESFNKQISLLNHQVRENERYVQEKTGQVNALQSEIASHKDILGQIEARMVEKDKVINAQQNEINELRRKEEGYRAHEERWKAMEGQAAQSIQLVEDMRRKMGQAESEFELKKKKQESEIERLNHEIEHLSRELSHAKLSVKEEVDKVQVENESRIKVLQSRLDWYDANARREYDAAREKVKAEMDVLAQQLKSAQDELESLRTSNEKKVEMAKQTQEMVDQLKQEKTSLEGELEQVRSEWKQVQWDLESRYKDALDQMKTEQFKARQVEEIKLGLEQELKQRTENLELQQSEYQQKMQELEHVRERFNILNKDLEMEKEKSEQYESQVESYKAMLHGKGLQATDELTAQIQEKTMALEKAKETIHRLNLEVQDVSKKDDMFKEKERALRQMMADKDEAHSDLKNKLMILSNKLNDLMNENSTLRENSKRERDQVEQGKQEAINRLMKQKQEEIEQAKKIAAEEAEQRVREELPPPGPNPQALAGQIRQQVEMEFMDRLREQESEWEKKLTQAKEESKKEIDKIRWDNENQREELRRAREARSQIEREAQELLQQAEEHYKKELNKRLAEAGEVSKEKNKGIFTAIGRILDTPLLDTKKNKDEEK